MFRNENPECGTQRTADWAGWAPVCGDADRHLHLTVFHTTVLDQLERPTPNPNPPKWYKGSIRKNSEFSQKMKYFSIYPVYWKWSKKNKKFKNLFNIDNSRVPIDRIIFKALILSGEHFLVDRIFKNPLFRMVYIGY